VEIPNLKHIFIGLNITKLNNGKGKYKGICVLSYSFGDKINNTMHQQILIEDETS